MDLAVLIGFLLIGTTLALNLWDTPTMYETWWYVLIASALSLSAISVTNVWIAVVLGWLAVHPLICSLLRKWNVLPVIGPVDVQLRALLAVLVWAVLYITIAHRILPARHLPFVAGFFVVWAVFHVVVGVLALRGHTPHNWRVVASQPLQPLMGYTGSGPSLAWLLAVASISAWYLGVLWSPWLWALIPGAFLAMRWTYNASAIVATVGALVVTGILLYPSFVQTAVVALLLATAWSLWPRIRGSTSFQARSEVWGWGLSAALSAYGVGIGIGSWRLFEFRRDQEIDDRTRYAWLTMHNDWLQACVEVGVIPVVLFGVYLGTHALAIGVSPHRHYAFALTVFSALYAMVYSPLHVQAQAAVLAVAMAGLDAGR